MSDARLDRVEVQPWGLAGERLGREDVALLRRGVGVHARPRGTAGFPLAPRARLGP
jgi:hypothetical protein